MDLLVVGGGGREHAVIKALRKKCYAFLRNKGLDRNEIFQSIKCFEM